MTPGVSLRPEIQGLRAIAVGLVLIFHIWPHILPGGFVGVDVFFVISGYLIVGSLVREAEREGRISLTAFYGRRVRRLLPAATVVLAFAFAGTLLWLPQARWSDTFLQIGASALYVQNWYLSWASVDYLAAENAASPVQHYWSLSIEEQFYIVWPFLMLGILAIARQIKTPVRNLLGAAVLVIFSASLAASFWLTETQPGAAYFVSHTRVWELALGGLLAIWLPAIKAADMVRALLFVLGLAAILVSGFLYDPSVVPFPGLSALLPTLGAAAIILAGNFRLSVFRGLDYAPLRYLGDVSYSVYLWHWPLIVFYQAAGYEIGLVSGLAILAVTLVVSHVSYVFVEGWFRHPDDAVEARTLPFGIASVGLIVCAVFVGVTVINRVPAGSETLVAGTSEEQLYPGPAALVAGSPVPSNVPMMPSPMRLLSDKAPVYASGCHQSQAASEVNVCTFGDPEGSVRVGVIGSSHSVNWLPAIDLLGQKNGWKVYSLTKSSCSFSRKDEEACNQWHQNLLAYLKENPLDVAFIGEMSHSQNATSAGEQLIAERFQAISDLGISIVAMRPTPQLETEPGDCLPDQIERCTIPRETADKANTVALAVRTVKNVVQIDLNDAICGRDVCSPVVGNLVVFRDKHHLTQTYSRALAPYLEAALKRDAAGLLPIRDGSFAAVSAPQTAEEGETSSALMTCSALSSSPGFARNYDLTLEGEELSLKRGSWEDQSDGFEIWTGTLSGDRVEISGEYAEGSPSLKKVQFSGTAAEGKLIAAGRRGPRVCSLVWSIPEGASGD